MSLKPTVRVRGLTAKELYAKSNEKIVSDIIRDQVRTIDAAIATAHESGFNHIEYELPVNFTLNNMDKADAQTKIYSEILSIYKTPEPEGKGYDSVTIDLRPRTTVLFITWINGMDQDERKKRQQFINSCKRK